MTASTIKRDAPLARPATLKFSWVWIGVLPFFLFTFMFLIYPASTIVVRTFQKSQPGAITLKTILGLNAPFFVNSYWVSIKLSVITALGGGVFGFLLAYSAIRGGLPHFMRTSLFTFCGVASNFAGVPLAFAFIALLSPTGMLTVWLRDLLGYNIYQHGFTLYTFWGLVLVYMFFQFPLMVLVIAPAIDGMRREWLEASENLGATSFQYWRYVALPILLPSLLGTMVLLFGNAFGAFATAFALTGGQISLVTIVIGAQLRGDILNDPGLGYALAFGMIIIMALAIGLYTILQRRTERWLR